MAKAKKTEPKKVIQLPAGILSTDLDYPKYDKHAKDPDNEYLYLDFELWKIQNFGWVIPTLDISNARRGTNYERRTYAIRLDNEGLVRVGKGPHVETTVQVYVTKKRVKELQKFIDLKKKGVAESQAARDTISTNRLQGSIRRRHLW
jgi:hypothetical protein